MSGRQTELPGNEAALSLQRSPEQQRSAAPAQHRVPHSTEPGHARPAGCVLAPSSPQLLLLAPLTCVCVCSMTIEGAISQLPGILATAASPEKACSSWSGDDSAAWALWPLADPWQGLQSKFWLPCLGQCFLAGTSR